jgi:hypothetical protein
MVEYSHDSLYLHCSTVNGALHIVPTILDAREMPWWGSESEVLSKIHTLNSGYTVFQQDRVRSRENTACSDLVQIALRPVYDRLKICVFERDLLHWVNESISHSNDLPIRCRIVLGIRFPCWFMRFITSGEYKLARIMLNIRAPKYWPHMHDHKFTRL